MRVGGSNVRFRSSNQIFMQENRNTQATLFTIEKAMDVAIVVLFLGVLIFLGNVFNRVFALTKIPDLLILIGIGILIGPVLGFIAPEEFGIVGPLFATVTLAVILFEGGASPENSDHKVSIPGHH
jgi:NhaP-type Na+/H+ and K+/H+ antiporter